MRGYNVITVCNDGRQYGWSSDDTTAEAAVRAMQERIRSGSYDIKAFVIIGPDAETATADAKGTFRGSSAHVVQAWHRQDAEQVA